MKEAEGNILQRNAGFYPALEEITARIFQVSGFEVSYSRDAPVDIIAKRDNENFCVEVKSSTSLVYRNYRLFENAVNEIRNAAQRSKSTPVLVIYNAVPERIMQKYIKSDKDVYILDLPKLLYAVRGTELWDELISLLPFSIDQIVLKENDLGLGWLCHSNETETLLQRLANCPSGKEGAKEFEEICSAILKFLFADDLSLWKAQAQSNDGLYRFDMLCRIKDDTSKSFWRIMEKHFHSKYIVFEFKNCTDKITQKEIYTTERYLYSKALRSVSIIISKSGFDENAVWAAKGSLRESGKLILLMTTDDLQTMIELKKDQEDPSDFLLSKLDDLLAELE